MPRLRSLAPAGFRVRHRRATAALAGLAAAALLAACGSSDTSGAGTGTTAVPSQDVVSAVTPDPALRAELPADVQQRGSLNLGIYINPGTNYLPHDGTLPSGQEVGVDVDLRNAVARKLGVSWNAENGTFATIIPGVQNGRYDVGMANFAVTKARLPTVDFSTYITDGQSFLGTASGGLSTIKDITDLCGKGIATANGSSFQQILTANAGKCAAAGKPAYQVQYFNDNATALLSLQNGKVDVVFGPTLSLQYMAVHVPNLKYLGQYSTTPVGFVTKKGSPLAKPLSDAVNALIASGDYARILAKWGATDDGVPHSEINPPAPF